VRSNILYIPQRRREEGLQELPELVEQRHSTSMGSNKLTRRQVLRMLSTGCAAFALPWADLTEVVAAQLRISPNLTAFPLHDVRLGDGPFLTAQKLDAKYLLQLEPDRLLHNFRVNAGLKPKAAVYGGWESVEPWIEIKCHGHTLGHYLSACAMMFAATADRKFKIRVDYIVRELRECQDAYKTGLICAFPDGQKPLDEIRETKRFVGVPWYTMHKIFAGLRDAYLYANSRTALDVLVKLSDWTIAHTKDLSDEQLQSMLKTEHGGMNEVLADVFELTGSRRFLELARKFSHRALLDPLIREQDSLDRLHSNTQIPKVIGFSRLYELSGESNYGRAAKFFWDTVVSNHTFVTGGNGDGEHFFPPAEFAKRLGSAKTMETCCAHNMLRLTRSLFMLDPAPRYADYYERALYNCILASQDPDSGMMTYFQPTRPGYLKLYCMPFDSFWCCTGSGMENHAKYGDSIYFHDATDLYVNLFIPSTVRWKEMDLELKQMTRFPDEEVSRFTFTLRKPVKVALKIRHPAWCETLTVSVNGRIVESSEMPGRYVAVDRVWKNGDRVEVKLPMSLRSEPLPGKSEVVAFMYGPIVLAGRLGTKGLTPGADIIVNERTTGDVLKADVPVPKLVGKAEDVVKTLKRTGPLSFEINNVSLIPYFRIAHERYTIYWELES
jgi:uncharacterized protein